MLKHRDDYMQKDLQIAGATQPEVLYLRYLDDYMFLQHNAFIFCPFHLVTEVTQILILA